MLADPYLRKLALGAIAARAHEPAPPTLVAAPDRPGLAAVADLPVGTPLAELCAEVPVCCPSPDRGRLSVARLLRDLGWAPGPGARLSAAVAPDRPVLWLDGATPRDTSPACACDGCDHDRTPPADRLLAAARRHPEPVTVDAAGRLRLTAGHRAVIGVASRAPVAVAALPELGLLAVTGTAALALHGALSGVRVPPV